MAVRRAANDLGLVLWTVATRADFYQGFLTPAELAPRVRVPGRDSDLVLYD